MINILRDKKSGKISSVNFCYYCDHETYPKGKPIVNDRHAVRTDKGDWKCGD